jgi:hypothetical protein
MKLRRTDIDIIFMENIRWHTNDIFEADRKARRTIYDIYMLVIPDIDACKSESVFCGWAVYAYILEKFFQYGFPVKYWFDFGFKMDGFMKPWDAELKEVK